MPSSVARQKPASWKPCASGTSRSAISAVRRSKADAGRSRGRGALGLILLTWGGGIGQGTIVSRAGMERGELPVSVMFVDVSGSTRLYADRGDTIALSIAVRVLRLMEEGVVSRQGWVIKTLGDGLLAVFSTPEDAVAAGGKILADVRDRLGHEGIRVRAGIHHGRTRTVGNDIFGDTVNVTARLAELAKADEILLSGEVHEELPGERRASARFVEEVEVRGHPVRVRVYQFLWHEEDVTVGLAPRRRPRPPRLDLRFEDIEIEVSPAKPLVTIGRGAECDVVVQDHAVSRHHADVALHGAGFALRDRSTNGTYVVLDGGETSRVFREEISLTGSGRILAGSETTEPILFRVRAG